MDTHENFMEKFAVLIPVYNEENNVVQLAEELQKLDIKYIFVDDGSTDKTVTKLWLKDLPAICYFPNRGKGFAIKLGAKYLINAGYEWILVMDGDGQCAVEDIEKFDNALLLNEEDTHIFIGNRMVNNASMPRLRRWVNKYISLVISKLADLSIPDTQCGFRLIYKGIFEHLDLKCNGFDFESEMLIKAGKANCIVKSIPIQCIYDEKRRSKIRPLRDGLRFLKLIFSCKFGFNK